MDCPKCGAPNDPGAGECEVCHTKMPPNCKGCGEKVPEGVEMCILCRTGRKAGTGRTDPVRADFEVPASSLPEGVDFTSDFVGRTDELKKMEMIFKGCLEGRYLHLVTLSGPPGVGKTRLALEVAPRMQNYAKDVKLLRGVCGGPGAPPYTGFIRVVADLAGVSREDGPAAIREKLVKTATEWLEESRVTEVSHLLAQMMQCPFPESPIVEPLAASPAQLEMRVFMALRRLFVAVADKNPLGILLDNVERASRETVNLLHYLAVGIRGRPVLLMAVGRPGLFKLHRQWGEGEFESARFELKPLTQDESEELLRSILTGLEIIPEALVHTVRNRLGGHPRSVEELIRYLIEVRILEKKDGRWTLDPDLLSAIDIPDSHEAIVEERLRSLEPAERDVLEKAAICGETFWLDLVVALYRISMLERGDPDGPTLDAIATAGDRTQTSVLDALERHAARGFIFKRSTTQVLGEQEYRFAYPPIWNLVCDKIDPEKSKRYHRLVAQWLELRPEGRSGSHQEEVGRHLELAGNREGAAQRYRRAADMARASYFNDRAITLYEKALNCVAEANISARIHVWHDLGSVHELKGEYEEALNAFEKMLRLGWVMASRAKGGVAFNKMGRVWRQKGELDRALDYLTRGKELFEQAGDARGIAGSLDDIGQVLWMQGKYEEALTQSSAALEQRRRIGDLRSIAASLSNIGNIETERGLLNEAASCHEEALGIRREINDRAGVTVSLDSLAHLEFLRGSTTRARQLWKEALSVAEEIDALPMQARALTKLAEVGLSQNQINEARQRLEEANDLCKILDEQRLLHEVLRNLALVELESSNPEKAMELAQDALQRAEKMGSREHVGRCLLALGRIRSATLFDSSGDDQATQSEEYFKKAVSLFREIGNEAELARALAEYGGFAAERSDEDTARPLLEESLTMFTRLGMKAREEVDALLGSLGGTDDEEKGADTIEEER